MGAGRGAGRRGGLGRSWGLIRGCEECADGRGSGGRAGLVAYIGLAGLLFRM